MREAVADKNTLKMSTSSFDSSNKPEPEYVLKVNLEDGNRVDVKSVSPKNNPNPENLPAVRKGANVFLRKMIVLVLFFMLCFLVAVLIGFNTLFMLFN